MKPEPGDRLGCNGPTTDAHGDEQARWPRWAVPLYFTLFVLGVPWYFPEGAVHPVIWGFPAWAAMSLLCSVGLSLVTAYLVLRHWPDSGGGSGDGV